ncbi:MAG: hypothetical protein KJP03_01440 [Gammaproteobacteria bacterium]|nr:hypothetical protein [Gammaproteobacteria bacterium]
MRVKIAVALLLCVGLAQAQDAGSQLDRLELDSSAITGNQELPRVMVIVPWKESGIGELSGKPVNSLLDEVLSPIDREVFQRQVRYFDQLYGVSE